jgi:uncharacterized protein with HEPN domain
MDRDIRVYIEDIVGAIEKINEYAGHIDELAFYGNTQIQDSVIRRLEIIGEAVKHVPDDIRQKYPDVPWKEIAGIRDVLIHEYFGVKTVRIWNIIKNDLPVFFERIRQVDRDLKEKE